MTLVRLSAWEGSALVGLSIEGEKTRGKAWLGQGGLDLRLGHLGEDAGDQTRFECGDCFLAACFLEEGFFGAGEGSIMVAQADFLPGTFFSITDGALERSVSLAEESCEEELIVDGNGAKVV